MLARWDRRFESGFLQRGVYCKPDFWGLIRGGDDVSGTKRRQMERRCCAEGQPLIFHSPLGVRHQVSDEVRGDYGGFRLREL